MSDKRYDGVSEMSRLSGVSQAEVLSIWEQVKVNHKKINECKKHRFPENDAVKIGQKFTCLECGGKMDLTRIGQYIDGYRAAGGSADDIWPGYTGKAKI